MADKKQGQNKKDKAQPVVPQVDNAQIQQRLADYRQIARRLNKSRTEEQVEQALQPITALSEESQMVLLKALARENTIEAADIALAVNTFAPAKEVRKEARRSLIHLEGTQTYPQWAPPYEPTLSDALVGSSILNSPALEEEDNVIDMFLDAWGNQEYEEAYDLLSSDSLIRDGLSRDEWVARRREWATQAQPMNVQVDVGYGLEADEDITAEDFDENSEELDAFWSIEMKDSPLSSTLPELPTATIVYNGTGRHWFWMGYRFIDEDDEIRIHSVIDKGAHVQSLSKEELEHRIDEIAEEVRAMSDALKEEEELDDDDNEDDAFAMLSEQLEEVVWFTKQAMHYNDALILQSPQDYKIYETASEQAVIVQDLERSAAYLERIAERFPEQRGDALRRLGVVLTTLVAEQDEENEIAEEDDEEPPEVENRYAILAEKALRDAMATDNDITSYILLGELLLEQDREADTIETLYEQAEKLATNAKERAVIEAGRARLARFSSKPEEALSHYQHAAEIAPDMPGVWYSIGDVQVLLDRQQDAEQSFLHSIAVEPQLTDAYGELATIYANRNDTASALNILQQGIDANPDAADLMAAQAMIYIEQGNLQRAEEIIEEAEDIDPSLEIVQIVHQVISMQKAQAQNPSSKSNKSKKRR